MMTVQVCSGKIVAVIFSPVIKSQPLSRYEIQTWDHSSNDVSTSATVNDSS